MLKEVLQTQSLLTIFQQPHKTEGYSDVPARSGAENRCGSQHEDTPYQRVRLPAAKQSSSPANRLTHKPRTPLWYGHSKSRCHKPHV